MADVARHAGTDVRAVPVTAGCSLGAGAHTIKSDKSESDKSDRGDAVISPQVANGPRGLQ
jgi:hypothetical protein